MPFMTVSESTHRHSFLILFLRSEPLSPAYTQGDGNHTHPTEWSSKNLWIDLKTASPPREGETRSTRGRGRLKLDDILREVVLLKTIL